MPLKLPKALRADDGRFICPVDRCGFRTKYQSCYNRHYDTKHKKTPRLICTCGKSAYMPYQLRKHWKRCEGSEALNKAQPGNPGFYVRQDEDEDEVDETIPVVGEVIPLVEINVADIRQENARLKIQLRERDEEIQELRKALEARDQPTTSYVDNGPPTPQLEERRRLGVEDDQSVPVPQELQFPLQVDQSVHPLEDNVAVVGDWLVLSEGEEDIPPIPQVIPPIPQVIPPIPQDVPLIPQDVPPIFLPRRSRRVPGKEKEKKQLELVLSTSDLETLGLLVKETAQMGRGVFANRVIEHGEWVVLYGGELLGEEEADGRVLERGETGYDFWFQEGRSGKWFCQDASSETGHPGRLINHSSRKFNLVAKMIPGMMKLAFKSAKKINVGEELFFDYNDTRRDVRAVNTWLK